MASSKPIAVLQPDPLNSLGTRLLRGIDFLDALVRWCRYPLLIAATLAYFAITCFRAARKPFWFDEVFTVYISNLSGVRAFWAACRSGVDFNPPLVYLFSHWTRDVFGPPEVSLRIPEITAFWIFCLCLYRFVSFRISPLAGFIAMLYPLTTEVYKYAYEVRPHALTLACFGLALVSWQALAGELSRRWLGLAGLTAALTGAALCHCFAFLIFVPLGVGELARSIRLRRIDRGAWCALLLPALVSVAIVVPLSQSFRGAIGQASVNWGTLMFSGWNLALMPEFLIAPLLVLVALPSCLGIRQTDSRFLPWDEIAVLVAALCAPVMALGAAYVGHVPLYARYCLILVGAVSCLLAVAAVRVKAVGMVTLALMVFTIAELHLGALAASRTKNPDAFNRMDALSPFFDWIRSNTPGTDPIAITNAFEFAPMFHYGPQDLLPRFVHLTPDANGEGYLRLQRCCDAPGMVRTQASFMAAHRSFYAYGLNNTLAEVSSSMQREGAAVTPIQCLAGADGRFCLTHVSFSAK